MYTIPETDGMCIRVMLRGQELSIDGEDGYIAQSPKLRAGDTIDVELHTRKGGNLLFFRAPDALSGIVRYTAQEPGGKAMITLHVPLLGEDNALLTPSYPANRIVIALDKKEDELLPRCIEIAVVAQRDKLFLVVEDYLNYQRTMEEDEFRTAVAEQFNLRPSKDPLSDPLVYWHALEEKLAFVWSYHRASGTGEVVLPDDSRVLVRWEEIMMEGVRFVGLEEHSIIEFDRVVELDTPRGSLTHELCEVTYYWGDEEDDDEGEEETPSSAS